MKKHKSFILTIIFLSIVFLQSQAYAQSTSSDWTLKINAEREDNKPYVKIGLAKDDYTLSNPPEPMGFKCHITLKSISDQMPLNSDIRKNGSPSYEWLLAVNPHGASPPYETSCLIHWNPNELGPGTLIMTDLSGNILIDNMKTLSSYSVSSSSNQYVHFTLKYQEISLMDLIHNLQILAGFKTSSHSDIDSNGIIELKDVICMIMAVAGQ
jgi:hypothetical protein